MGHFILLQRKFSWSNFSKTTVKKMPPTKITLLSSIIPKENPKKNKIFQEEKQKQIVQTNQESLETPVETKFLSEKNNKVEKQTRAQKTDTFNNKTKEISPPVASLPSKTRPLKKENKQSLEAFKLTPESLKEHTARQHQARNQRPSLSPLQENASSDFLEDIEIGNLTQLNTQEFKYYSFYQRIRERLEQHWGKGLQKTAEQLFRQGIRLPSQEHHITSLKIIINQQGIITKVFVKGESGVHALDQVAIDSFFKAGPFPNPPQELVKNGEAEIEWGFVVKT